MEAKRSVIINCDIVQCEATVMPRARQDTVFIVKCTVGSCSTTQSLCGMQVPSRASVVRQGCPPAVLDPEMSSE